MNGLNKLLETIENMKTTEMIQIHANKDGTHGVYLYNLELGKVSIELKLLLNK